MDDSITRTLEAQRGLGGGRFSLVVYHDGRTRVVLLRAGEPVLVGRGEDATLQIQDETISRAHTRFVLEGDDVWVEDQRSKNGTVLNGERIVRARVTPHDRIAIGAASAFLHLTRPLVEVEGVEAHEVLLDALEDLLRRARGTGRKLALCVLQAGREVEPEAWFAALSAETGPYDRLAAYGPRTAELVIWDPDARTLEERVKRLLQPAKGVRAGLAFFPDLLGSGEELLAAARDAALAATSEQPIRWASAAQPDEGQPLVASEAMREVFAIASQLARSTVPVLVVGETGTGKEHVARQIHLQGARAKQPLISVNCAAIPANLVEAELFGHERGAFTGADRKTKGVFEEAHGGTLFLDEIGELPLAAQAALLRVLETRRFARIGSAREIEVDVRLLAATHQDLEAMCREQRFRLDLYFRINTVTVKVPALRERPEEIGPLAERFLDQACHAQGRPRLRIGPEVMSLLHQHAWPGNVRELRNAMERAAALATGDEVLLTHLPERIFEAAARGAVARSPLAPSGDDPLPAEVIDLLRGPRGPSADDFRHFILRTESALIASALEASGGNKTAASRSLGMPLRTLKERLRGEGAPPDPTLTEALERVVPASESIELRHRVRRYELALIGWALREASGSRTEAARLLRIPERTLRERLREGPSS